MDASHEVSLNDDENGKNLLEEDEGIFSSPQRNTLEAALEEEEIIDSMTGRNQGEEVKSKLVMAEPTKPTTTQPSSSTIEEEQPVGDITVNIVNFEKRGEGINSYIVYLVVTQVKGVVGYSRDRYEVWRRFSDFLGLHEKLAEKFAGRGIILPQPPEKSITTLTKTKTGNPESNSTKDLATLRKRLLERYMGRLSEHGSIRSDCDVRDFLTMDVELPKATNTATISSASVKKMFKSVGEAFSKMAVHMEEGDRWFEQIQSQTDEQEDAIRRMHSVAESLVQTRRDLAAVGETFSKALSLLASCEESTALARCLSHLTEAEETIALNWEKQADLDASELSEALGEYVSLFNSLRLAFGERHRVWHNWQSAQQNITKKREQKTRLELAGKTEKAATLRAETEEAVQKADQLETQFGRISEEIRKEYTKFEANRKRDIKAILIKFLESMVATQEEMLKAWQRFAPETAIISI